MPFNIEEPGKPNSQEDSAPDIIVGIDFGTTNSLITIIEDNKVKLLNDDVGNNLIPSKVAFNNDGSVIAIGHEQEGAINISSIKRLLGKSYDDVKGENLGFKISPNNNLTIEIGPNKYRPEEIAAKILKYLKEIAQKNLAQEVKKCVLTVPAYFDESAKNAVKHAALLADLEVVRLLNEPTAAALAYGLENKGEGLYCVYDLGGGTFDVSILKMQQGVFKVIGVAGNNEFGGDDIDNALVKKYPNLSKNQAKKIKESFASNDKVEMFDVKITQVQFNNIIDSQINNTINLTNDLIDDLELSADDIKGVIMVGGSTRVKLITDKLAAIFGNEKILTNLDPDRVVANGAAWQAYNLSGRGQNLLLDVVPLSLGVEMMGGIVDKIIERNSATPCSYAKEFTTYADNQTAIKFHIVQGEREMAKDCRSLAHFEVKGIPPMKAGMAKVLVIFKVDSDGLLTISAEEKYTQSKTEIIVKPTYALDEEQVKNMLFDSLKNSKDDIAQRLLIEAINIAKKDIAIITKDLKKNPPLVSDKEKAEIEEKMQLLQNLIDQGQSKDDIEKATAKFHKATENLVLKKVNNVLNSQMSGKKIDEV